MGNGWGEWVGGMGGAKVSCRCPSENEGGRYGRGLEKKGFGVWALFFVVPMERPVASWGGVYFG